MSADKALLKLLRMAMGNEKDYSLPSDILWDDILLLAEQQGVLCLTFDAVQKLPKKLLPDTSTLMNWLGKVEYMRMMYESYRASVYKLSALFAREGLRMMVMKGYGCSRNYPHPESRYMGDIDIWLFGKQNEGNRLIESKGIQVRHDNDHHSVFTFEGFTIENHKTILDVNTHKSSKRLEPLLEQLATEEQQTCVEDGMTVYLPSTRFNSIHLLRHMANDFATVRTSLRHLLDWATFVQSSDVDWDFVHTIARENNMSRFLDAINGVCIKYLGYPEELFPIENIDVALRDRVLGDIVHPEFEDKIPPISNRLRYGWIKTKRLWANRWKYKIVYDESIWESFCTLSVNRFKRTVIDE